MRSNLLLVIMCLQIAIFLALALLIDWQEIHFLMRIMIVILYFYSLTISAYLFLTEK